MLLVLIWKLFWWGRLRIFNYDLLPAWYINVLKPCSIEIIPYLISAFRSTLQFMGATYWYSYVLLHFILNCFKSETNESFLEKLYPSVARECLATQCCQFEMLNMIMMICINHPQRSLSPLVVVLDRCAVLKKYNHCVLPLESLNQLPVFQLFIVFIQLHLFFFLMVWIFVEK